VVPPGLEPGTN